MSRTASRAALFVVLAVGLAACGGQADESATAEGSSAAVTGSTCAQYGTINQGAYIIQADEWNSTATQCLSSTGNNFTVTTANFNMPNGAPASYPSIFKGCHWGTCTSGSGMPVQVSSATASTSVSITTTSGNWDSAYDIWFNTTPTTSGQPNGTELMIWVNHQGFPQPIGSKRATVTIDGSSWDVWIGNSGWNVISYVKTSPATSVSLDLKPFFQDAVSRGQLQNSWYLIAIEYGFEIWTGGQGLAVNSFSATVGSGGSSSSSSSSSSSGGGSSSSSSSSSSSGGSSSGGSGSCKSVSGGQSGNFNTTGAACFTVSSKINGWGCSNTTGRTVSVNGQSVSCGQLPLPGSAPYTFSFGAGSYPWASFYWW